MTRIFCKAILCLVLLYTSSCKAVGEDGGSDDVVAIDNVEVLPIEDNALRMEVAFTTNDQVSCQIVYWKSDDSGPVLCSPASSVGCDHSITLLYLEANSEYEFQIEMVDSQVTSDIYTFETEGVITDVASFVDKAIVKDFNFDGYLLYSCKRMNYHIMVNSDHKIVWYETLDKMHSGGARYDARTKEISYLYGESDYVFCSSDIASMDLYGNIVMRHLCEDLPNPKVHHDIFQLSNGNWMYVNFIDKEYDLSSVGGEKSTIVRGDGLTEIDRNGNVVWEWNAFDYADPVQDPDILDPKGAFGIWAVVEDWLHGNSIGEDADGNIYISFNRLAQLWKIDKSSGEVLYKLGRGGDVEIDDEATPLCMHSLSILDNGNILFYENPDSEREYARILEFKVDQESKKAELITNIRLPEELTSSFQGSVYELDSRHFIVHSTNDNITAVIDRMGNVVWMAGLSDNSFRAQYIPFSAL